MTRVMMRKALFTSRIVCAAIIGTAVLCCAALAFGQEKTSTSKTEPTESGGKKTTNEKTYKDGSKTVEVKIYDKNGKLRREETTAINSEGEKSTEARYYNCDGQLETRYLDRKDSSGKKLSSQNEHYNKEGVLESGEIYEFENGKVKSYKKYDPVTEKYEESTPPKPFVGFDIGLPATSACSDVLTAAPSYGIETDAGSGLYTVSLTTPGGKLQIYLPDDVTAGDTFTGTIEKQPAGRTDAERNQNQSELNRYVIELARHQSRVNERTITREIPAVLTTADRIIRILRDAHEVARAELPISSARKEKPTAFTLPGGGQQGWPLEVEGPFDGIIRDTDYVKVGQTTLPILAESPRQKVARNASDVIGPTTIACAENGRVSECPFRNLGVQLSADKLSLLKGETTTLHVTVLGLRDLREDIPLDLVNRSPEIIGLARGNDQHLSISSRQISSSGTFSIDRTLSGIKAGSFNITATVTWSDVCAQPRILAGLIPTPLIPRREKLPGKCDGTPTLIAVPNGIGSALTLPTNLGTCFLWIYSIDPNGKELNNSRVGLEAGEQLQQYVASADAEKIVFVCSEKEDGTCALGVDHHDRDPFKPTIAYTVPRGVVKGKCDGKETAIYDPAVPGEKIHWIKNVGTCPVMLYSIDNQGKRADEVVTLKPSQVLPTYVVPLKGPAAKVVFKCASDDGGTCEIEFDSFPGNPFPLPEDVVLKKTTLKRIFEGKCDGQEKVLSIVNGTTERLVGIKNVGTCPLEIYSVDDNGKQIKQAAGQNVLPVKLQPNETKPNYVSEADAMKIVFKCVGAQEGKCALEIEERDVEFTMKTNEGAPADDTIYVLPRVTVNRGSCAAADPDPTPLTRPNGENVPLKWIRNTGTCPLLIYSTGESGDPIGQKFRLDPGEQIESYYPEPLSNGKGRARQIVFKCIQSAQGNCQIEYARP